MAKETRYDVSYVIGNQWCGMLESKTFINKPFSDVINFLIDLKKEFKDCTVSFEIFEGWGFDQHKLTSEEIGKKGWC